MSNLEIKIERSGDCGRRFCGPECEDCRASKEEAIQAEMVMARDILDNYNDGRPSPGDPFQAEGSCGAQHEGLINDALYRFEENAKFSVISNSSISCITLLAQYNNEDSPLVNTRLPRNPIRHLLYKFFLVTDGQKIMHAPMLLRQGRKNIQVQNRAEFRAEIQTQVNAYNKMYGLVGDPNVPNIIYALSKIPFRLKEEMFNYYAEKLLQGELDQLLEFFKAPYHIALCVMEYMDGYITLEDYILSGDEYEQSVIPYVNFELMMLISCGIIHLDAHPQNIMININKPNYYGQGINFKIIILDFGIVKHVPYEVSMVPLHIFTNAIVHFKNYINPLYGIDEEIYIDTMVQIFNNFINSGLQSGIYANLEPYKRLKPYLDILGRKKKSKKKRGSKK